MAKSFGWTSANNIISFALLVPLAIAVAGPPNPAQSQTPDAQLPHVPEPVERAIINGPLAKKYEVSFRLNLFYLRGDFNGDGKIDVAVLVTQRSTGKTGIAIIDGVTNKVTILGAGTAVAMVAMTSSGWIRGRFIRKPAWHQEAMEKTLRIFAETHFSWARVRQPAR